VIPVEFLKLVSGPDAQKSSRAMQAMFGMKKLDINLLKKAAEGK
jgi:hypothetical protein